MPDDDDLAWAERLPPTAVEQEAIAEIERCRTLADRLRERLRSTT